MPAHGLSAPLPAFFFCTYTAKPPLWACTMVPWAPRYGGLLPSLRPHTPEFREMEKSGEAQHVLVKDAHDYKRKTWERVEDLWLRGRTCALHAQGSGSTSSIRRKKDPMSEMYPKGPTHICCNAVHTCAHMHTQRKSDTWPGLSHSRMWLCLHHSVLNVRQLLAIICSFLSFPSVSPSPIPSLSLCMARPQGGFS